MTQVRKIVINTCFGGFGLSLAAAELLADRKNVEVDTLRMYDLTRDDADLVYVVETLGKKASDRYAELKVVEIPADVNWYIDEYDGFEEVAEIHRRWS